MPEPSEGLVTAHYCHACGLAVERGLSVCAVGTGCDAVPGQPPTLTLPGMEAEARSRKLSQLFTPVELAQRIWEWSGAPRASGPLRVLEPSCGSGNIIAGMLAAGVVPATLQAIDNDLRMVVATRDRFQHGPLQGRIHHHCCDFLTWKTEQRFDLAVMNPKYEGNAAIRHCARALEVCDRVIALLPDDVFYTAGRVPFFLKHAVHRRVNLSYRPKFGAEGGQINSVVLELRKRPGGHVLALGEPQTVSEEWW